MKKPYYIDYPQEHIEGHAHQYRCMFCKLETTMINGRLEGHLPTCEYRASMMNAGFEEACAAQTSTLHDADDFD